MLSQTGMLLKGISGNIIRSVVGTLMMAFYANLPYAQAPGMSRCLLYLYSGPFGMGYSWKEALGMVFMFAD